MTLPAPRRVPLRDSDVAARQWHQFYTDEEREQVLDRLCHHLTTEGVGKMVAFLASIGVSWSTVYRWMSLDVEIMQRVRDAQLAGTFIVAEEILRIADDASDDYELGDDGKLRVVPETVARAKLRIDSRWRYLSCIHPIVWGSKMAAIGSPEEQASRDQRGNLSDAERAHRIAQLLGAASSRPTSACSSGRPSKVTVVTEAENGPVE